MDAKQLVNFIALARELHYSRTAKSLGVSQSTLSSQIMALEAELGARLFERTKRNVRLTNAGALLLQEAPAIMDQLERLVERVGEAHAGQRGVLRIGVSRPAISTRFPDIARIFQASFPDVELEIQVDYSNNLIERLERRRIDLVFGRADVEAVAIDSETLWRIPFRIVLPSGHRESKRSAVRLSKLSGETLFTYPRELVGASYDQLIAYCQAQHFVPKAIQEISESDTIVGLVACGLGVSIIASGGAILSPGTVSKPIANSQNFRQSIAAYWRSSEKSGLLSGLLDIARKVAPL